MPARRIYIDSRYRPPSGRENDFNFALKTPMEIARGTQGWVDGVVISHSFNTVIRGHSDTLFAREVLGATYEDKVLTIPTGDYNGYTLATAIETLLNLCLFTSSLVGDL